jgi:general secretion pathway protein L
MTENESTNAVARFYAWWLRELSKALTPRRPATRAWRTLLLHTSEGLEISTKTAGSSKQIGTLRPGATSDQVAALRRLVLAQAGSNAKQVVLRLSPDDVVERTIQIPEAASDVIEPVLENQMERIVPWSQEDTRYGYRIVGPNAAAPDQLDIHVVATTRGILDTAVRRAQSVGLTPYAVEFAPALETAPAIELMSMEADPVKKTAAALQTSFALVLAFCLAIGGFGLYHVWDRQAQNDDLEAKIATTKARVEEVKRLNDENAALKEQRERLVRRKMGDRAMVVLIEALSRALPDTAYLQELEIHGRETRIVGKSVDPTGLITQLEDTAEFEDVRFAAPTTREEGETLGTFSIIGRAQGGSGMEKQP